MKRRWKGERAESQSKGEMPKRVLKRKGLWLFGSVGFKYSHIRSIWYVIIRDKVINVIIAKSKVLVGCWTEENVLSSSLGVSRYWVVKWITSS